MSQNQFFAAAFSVSFVGNDTPCDVSSLPIATPSRPTAAGTFKVARVDTKPFATVYEMECTAGGGPVKVEVSTRGRIRPSVPAGATVKAKAVSTGIVLAAGSEAIAFIPNALGRALLRSELMRA